MGTIPAQGIFNMPATDTTHVWELNFEKNYLEIHPADNFQMPASCIVSPIIEAPNAKYGIQIPLQIISGKDTLISNEMYMIDTGNSYLDIIVTPPAKAIEFLNQYNNDLWFTFGSNYIRRHIVKAIAWHTVPVDTLKIYTLDRIRGFQFVGNNFLKRFNVFFDLSKKQIGLQPITYQRLITPYSRVFHYSFDDRPTRRGHYTINCIGNFQANYYQAAGLQVGDEIVAVNNISYQQIVDDEVDYAEIRENSDTLIYDIVRKGKPMKIPVIVDKNEPHGDL
jgi:hypothetical protein